MRIPKPFLPVKITTEDLYHKVDVVGRTYTFGPDGMIHSIKSLGCELLASPMRIVMKEDGKDAVFNDDYKSNESESFIQSRNEENAVVCGCKQSERFIVDFTNTINYDGNIDIDVKFMTKGLTVAQVLGVSDMEPLKYKLDNLWLEIPLKKEVCSLYHFFRRNDGEIYFSDGTVKEQTLTSASGALPEKDFHVPFRPLFWLGNEDMGFGWSAENCRNWQTDDEKNAIEIVHGDDCVIMRIHLLDSHPVNWQGDLTKGPHEFYPISFSFSVLATPVKPFPENPYLHNAFHLDCGKKIKGNYGEFLSDNNHFEKLKEMGVTTLILHEKWNKSQNWFELSEFTANQLRFIVEKCHSMGIKVMPYFGYEISTMSRVWNELSDKVICKKQDGKNDGGWWRVPFQRAYIACQASEYSDLYADGVIKLIDEFNLDGIYLDGPAYPWPCFSLDHGCGWYNEKGELCPTYPLKSIRKLFQKLYVAVKERGGMISVHSSGVVNFTALGFIDQNWFGENLQSDFMKGIRKDVELDYFRAEYSGRNMGVPTEFIAYENRPVWTFENALSCSILHGILPRPNDIDHPLELMSGVWKIFDSFPIEKSEWKPYWKNSVQTGNEKVKVSYYKYKTLSDEDTLLAFVVNISPDLQKDVHISFEENVNMAKDMTTGQDSGFSFDLEPYGYKIMYIR
ncbi:MAG: hypothetical protein E7394_06935 [Ruminococcaceae bacterium]|nr:hypothetical protein [Oscillospiraceae bacterium]